jgi:hypothetical protein
MHRSDSVLDLNMTLQALAWYRVRETKQYAQIASIFSTAIPSLQVKTADESMNAFHVALIWFTRSNTETWTKRAILLGLKKTFALLREPLEDDLPIISKLKAGAGDIPFHSMSVDGEKTEPSK